jgi:hypothetical protein
MQNGYRSLQLNNKFIFYFLPFYPSSLQPFLLYSLAARGIEKWFETKKNGPEQKKMKGNEKKWSGAEKNEWEQKKMVRNGKKWSETGKNDPDREKVVRTKKTSFEYGVANYFI